jgi:hypothetical protein
MDYGVHAVVTDCERDHVTWNIKPNLEQETKNKLHPLFQHDECLFMWNSAFGDHIWTHWDLTFDNYKFVNG